MKAYGSKIIVGVPNYGGWTTDNQAPECYCCNGKYAKLRPKGKSKHLRMMKDRARKEATAQIKEQLEAA